MYTAFFGLNIQPFSIAPNPDFMYLGNRHTEALAHLRYGLGDAGGFVLLTGEVGTGKTTVSRCLLAELPANTQVAFILNPTLSELELLAAICDELKIRYKKTDASLKLLTDKITNKLQKNHQAGINTILIIDEAQHLQPAVLEQLRLLTNLETNTKKLLQVILIGQPELQQLLQRQDLRQLAQRITARYHLMPLTLPEVKYYVEHRLQVAGCSRPVFTDAALKKLFEFSGGIPRLLNLLCDRALLGGYSQQKALVDGKLIELAAGEILAIKAPAPKPALPIWLWPLVFLLCLALGVSLALLWLQN
jgi:general secretion pathway protein A